MFLVLFEYLSAVIAKTIFFMTRRINCFIPYQDKVQVAETVKGLQEAGLVNKIYLLTTESESEVLEGCELLRVDSLKCTPAIKKIAERSDADFSLIYTKDSVS